MGTVIYNVKQALTQMWRNKGMALASVFAITAMMMILGLFFVVIVNINMFTETLRNNFNEIEVFLSDEVTEEEARDIMGEMEVSGGVLDVRYRTKEEAMDILKARWGSNSYLLDTLGQNPLPNSIIATVDSMEAANDVTDNLNGVYGIEDIKYYKETVEKLSKITGFIQVVALFIIMFLVLVSIVVVANTIKLTVFARSKEIEIMKYIGGTNWFIRGPFLSEGIIMGMISATIAALITYGVYDRVINLIGVEFTTILSTPLISSAYLSGNLIIIFIAMGVGIGACGSIVSMRKFLDT